VTGSSGRSFVKNSRRYFRHVPMRDKFLYPKDDGNNSVLAQLKAARI